MNKQVAKIIKEEILNEVNEVRFSKLIQSPEAYSILDNSNSPDATWQHGGCWILADALSIYFSVPVYVVYNLDLNRVDHFMVKFNTLFLDSDGFHSPQLMIKKIIQGRQEEYPNEKPWNLIILPYINDMNTDVIPEDKKASQELVELFKKYKLRNI